MVYVYKSRIVGIYRVNLPGGKISWMSKHENENLKSQNMPFSDGRFTVFVVSLKSMNNDTFIWQQKVLELCHYNQNEVKETYPVSTYYLDMAMECYGSIPISSIFRGLFTFIHIHKSQLF